jgi:hypothetical protein
MSPLWKAPGLITNNRLGKKLPRTNTPAYFAASSITKTGFSDIDTRGLNYKLFT